MGRYCSYLLPKQTGGTTQILVFKTLRMIGRPALYTLMIILGHGQSLSSVASPTHGFPPCSADVASTLVLDMVLSSWPSYSSLQGTQLLEQALQLSAQTLHLLQLSHAQSTEGNIYSMVRIVATRHLVYSLGSQSTLPVVTPVLVVPLTSVSFLHQQLLWKAFAGFPCASSKVSSTHAK